MREDAIDHDFFYLSYGDKLHISTAVKAQAEGRKNGSVKGTLCYPKNFYATRPTSHDLIYLPICQKCQEGLNLLERKHGVKP